MESVRVVSTLSSSARMKEKVRVCLKGLMPEIISGKKGRNCVDIFASITFVFCGLIEECRYI